MYHRAGARCSSCGWRAWPRRQEPTRRTASSAKTARTGSPPATSAPANASAATGQLAAVESLRLKPGQHRVYNLEVEHEHQFYVGEAGVLVHNAVQFKRWRRGDAIDKPLANGAEPSWGTVQSAILEEPIRAARNTSEFSAANLSRMNQMGRHRSITTHGRASGRAGNSITSFHSERESTTARLTCRELTPDWHAEVDPLRNVPGIVPNRGDSLMDFDYLHEVEDVVLQCEGKQPLCCVVRLLKA